MSGNKRKYVRKCPDRTALALHALGNEQRRAIINKLITRPACVHQITEALTITRPAVSQHLKVLHDAVLITSFKQGSRNFYQIRMEGFIALQDYLSLIVTVTKH